MKTRHEYPAPDSSGNAMYYRFGLMLVLSFVAMYGLMYAMVDRFSNVIPNVNQFYMAGLMTMPMLILEILVMGSMYGKKKLNLVLVLAGISGLVGFYMGIREQVAVKDKQFLKSMIPHHAAAILMVEKASLTDPEIKRLADEIVQAQEGEIAWMKAKLQELETR